ncbi:hypothetical protein Gpo141_00000929 [Globisporangium polare]
MLKDRKALLAAVDAASVRRWLHLLEVAIAQLYAKPRTESTLKYAGGVIAAFFAIKYSRSFTSAGFIGLFSGILAHSIYADVLKKAKKKPSRLSAADARMLRDGDEEQERDDESESRDQ